MTTRMFKSKVEIKNRFTGEVMFKGDNLIALVRDNRANLSCADLSGADLSGANLYRANLSGANLSGAIGINPYLITPLLILKDMPGKIRAYKLVDEKMEGHCKGGLKYAKGKIVEVKDANTDTNEHCGAGVNLATLDWVMREWREGYRILVAEFTAKDIASIPTGTDGKFRVFRCKIVGEKDLKEIGLINPAQHKNETSPDKGGVK